MSESSDARTPYRQTATQRIAIAYVTPLFLYAIYALYAMPTATAWGVVIAGLLITTAGASYLVMSLYQWEYVQRRKMEALLSEQAVATPTQEAREIAPSSND